MWWIKQNHVNLSFLSSEGIMGANLRHFNGLTKVLQSHCSALLSQMWMRPLQPPHPKQRKQTSLIHNVNMQVYQVNFPPFSISSVDPSVLLLHSYNGAQFLFSSHAHFFFFYLPHIYLMYLTCSNLHNYSFTVTQRGPPAFCSEKGLAGNHNIRAKKYKGKGKTITHKAQYCSS